MAGRNLGQILESHLSKNKQTKKLSCKRQLFAWENFGTKSYYRSKILLNCRENFGNSSVKSTALPEFWAERFILLFYSCFSSNHFFAYSAMKGVMSFMFMLEVFMQRS